MNFAGRANSLLLFTHEGSGVIIDSEFGLVVASGKADFLLRSRGWSNGEYDENAEQLASASLFSMDATAAAAAGRMYTIPKGVQNAARTALRESLSEATIGTPAGLAMARKLSKGGQIGMGQLRTIDGYFARHGEATVSEKASSLWGGAPAKKWASSIISREPIVASGVENADIDAFRQAYELDSENGIEFLVRMGLDGSGIDRLYKIDFDGQVYVWDDNTWTDMGNVDSDIWTHDRALDDVYDTAPKTHLVIDADSAVIIGARLANDPFTNVTLEDLDEDEATLLAEAASDIDWNTIDKALIAAGEAFDATPGVDTPEERAERASTQVRDKNGKFATAGSRVMVNGNPNDVGKITSVNGPAGTVDVLLDNGATVTVTGKSVEGVGAYTTTIPGEPVNVPRIDTTGILAEPRTPINRVGAQIPGTLPQMTAHALHEMIGAWPAYVKNMRDNFLPGVAGPSKVKVQDKDSLDKGTKVPSGLSLTTDAYDHPLLIDWLKKKDRQARPNSENYNPITAAAEGTATATAEAVTPDNCDVQPIYMAIVAPEDPRAVLNLVSLVPSSTKSPAPMTFVRKEGAWIKDEQVINDLNSPTPPPVVPLDSETLVDVIEQVDSKVQPEEPSAAAPVAASGISMDQALMILWGPNPAAIAAAGGLDRNNGGAEKLRQYWTRGEGALKIRWGTPGDWTRCVRHLGKYMGVRAKGYCQLRHKEATGVYTGDDKNASLTDSVETEITQADLDKPIEQYLVESVEDPEFEDDWNPPIEITDIISNDFGDVQEVQETLTESFETMREGVSRMGLTLLAAGGLDQNRGNAEKLRRYWTWGQGGAKIRWGSGGDWTRCVRHLTKYMGPRANGYCALRHKEMTGMWTGDKRHRQIYGRATGLTFSNDIVDTSDAFMDKVVLRTRAQAAKERLGLVASAGPDVHGARFTIPLVIPEGAESGDGRIAAPGAMSIRDLPIALMWQVESNDGHKGSYVVGRIDSMERINGGIGNAHGVFDTGVWGREAERMVRLGFLRGVSADMDQFEAVQIDDEPDINDPSSAADAEDTIKSERTIIKKARIMAVTIVAKPAFQECRIILDDEEYLEEEDPLDIPDFVSEDAGPGNELALVACGYVASAIPLAPPKTWFEQPVLKGPTPLSVDDDGRVFGHIAVWGTDHIGMGGNTKPPRSRSKYAYFQTGVLRTAEGDDVNVGQITLAGGHASLYASASDAVRHYDDTASAVADVRAGEDQFGIWVSGGLRPGVTPEQVRVMRASAPSGDWRPVNGKLELVAVCQVNVPGFPTARAMVASGSQEVYALVAAGAQPLAMLKAQQQIDSSSTFETVDEGTMALVASIEEKFATLKRERNAELSAKSEALYANILKSLDAFSDVPAAKREELAKKGHALPDGSFPIATVADLKKAIKAFGRAKDSDRAAVKRHIKKRARALNQENLIPDTWKAPSSASVAANLDNMRAIIAAAAARSKDEDKQTPPQPSESTPEGDEPNPKVAEPETAPEGEAEAPVVPTVADIEEAKAEVDEGIYTPETQPRDKEGRFRDILARLRDNLGVSGNQAVVEKLKETQNIYNTGDYKAADTAANELVSIIDRLDSGALNADSLINVRLATTELGKTIANLPLPFENQAQKVRYSDLPPALRTLMDELVDKVVDKIGAAEGGKATSELRGFMSGADVYSQSEVSAQLNRMLRLLT